MNERIVVIGLCLFFTFCSFTRLNAQPNDHVGSGRAIQFDGVNDYIDLGNIFDDLSLPVTISVWVNVTSGSSYAFPIFNSQDNLPLYNGVTFAVSPSAFSIQYGDGQGENDPAFRRGMSALIPDIAGRWVNITAIMRGRSDMELFLNGIKLLDSEYSGSTNLPMASMSSGDVAKIGTWFSNGITTYFKGLMDELRIFNRSLSETEIRDQMCKKLSGNEPGLIGYWTFDETSGNVLKDKSPNHFDGLLVGNPTRVFSGAPIGDESVYLYPNGWTNTTLKLDDIEAVNIQGNPAGLHIYKVRDIPSQTGGLDLSKPNQPYYGLYFAAVDQNSFDFTTTTGHLPCKVFQRSDNSKASWTTTNTYTSFTDPREILLVFPEIIEEIDFGVDKIVCDKNGYVLEIDSDLTGKSILWNTGETTTSINVTQSGVYSVQVSSNCKVDMDSISIDFLSAPPLFSLGKDDSLCSVAPTVLKPYDNSQGFAFEWQDGSKGDRLKIQGFGKYWVSIKNGCGVATDTLQIFELETEENFPAIDLGADQVICDKNMYVIKITGDLAGKSVHWNTGNTSSDINVTQSGIYSVQVSSRCKTDTDSINIAFLSPPPPFSLGKDDSLCVIGPMVLKPYSESFDFEFEWQSGSKADSLQVEGFGEYWVSVKNACGIVTDTIRFSKPKIRTDPPNIITPNGDPFNQYFVVAQLPKERIKLIIYNRWGADVFGSDDYKSDWDGGALSAGVYYYQLRGECLGEKKGTVTISR